MPLQVRRGVMEDVEQMITMQMHMAKETEKLTLNVETLRAGITRVIKDSSLGNYYIVEDTNCNEDVNKQSTNDAHVTHINEWNNNMNSESPRPIVGMLLTTHEWSDWRNGCVLWIQSAYVVPSCRRRGVFTAMFQYLHDMVTKSDFYVGIRLYVEHENHNAQRTYEKLGMTREHYNMMKWTKTKF